MTKDKKRIEDEKGKEKRARKSRVKSRYLPWYSDLGAIFNYAASIPRT